MKIELDFKSLDVDVEFKYYEAEPEVRYYKDGSGQPGTPSFVEISNVYHQKVDITEFLEEVGLMYELEEATLIAYENCQPDGPDD